jgi:hypothetical protein
VTALPREEPAGDRATVILTPDQRVRVFISSTLQELAAVLTRIDIREGKPMSPPHEHRQPRRDARRARRPGAPPPVFEGIQGLASSVLAPNDAKEPDFASAFDKETS